MKSLILRHCVEKEKIIIDAYESDDRQASQKEQQSVINSDHNKPSNHITH